MAILEPEDAETTLVRSDPVDSLDGPGSRAPCSASRVSICCLVGSASGPSRNIHSEARTHSRTISGVVLNEAAVAHQAAVRDRHFGLDVDAARR
jgi:hypothetical protein